MADKEGMGVNGGGQTPERRRREIANRLERLPFSAFHLHVASILAAGTFFDAYDAVCIASALTVIFTSLHTGYFNAGILISSAFVGQFIGAWCFGAISEKYGRKIAFVGSTALFSLLSIATACAPDLNSLLVLRALQGIGLGGEVPVAAALINEFLRSAKRGKITLTYQSIFLWAAMITPLIALLCFQLFGHKHGWRAIFAVGGVPLLVALYAWFRLPESPRWLAQQNRFDEAEAIVQQAESTSKAEPEVSSSRPGEKDNFVRQQNGGLAELFSASYLPRTIMLWVHSACTYFVTHGFDIWLPTLLMKFGGLPVTYALLLSIAWPAIKLPSLYVQTTLIDSLGRKPLFVFGFFLTAFGGILGAIMVHVMRASNWQALMCACILFSLGTSLCSQSIWHYTAELYPTRLRGLGVSSVFGISRIACIVAPIAVGALLSHHFGIQSVFAMFGLVGLIGAITVANLGIETKMRSLEELSP